MRHAVFYQRHHARAAGFQIGDGAIDGGRVQGCWERAGSREGEYIDWLAFKDQKQAVLDDAARIKAHPLVPKTIPIHGFIFDVKTGRLVEVEEAKALGAAR
jgi:carbonic anhydrase